VSAIDWHIEFAQIKGSLEQVREDYETPDGYRMTLRPLYSVLPEQVTVSPFRSMTFFSELHRALAGSNESISKSKLKGLRNAIRQGNEESDFYLHMQQLHSLITSAMNTICRTMQIPDVPTSVYHQVDADKRCLLFDAIEIIDHCTLFEEDRP